MSASTRAVHGNSPRRTWNEVAPSFKIRVQYSLYSHSSAFVREVPVNFGPTLAFGEGGSPGPSVRRRTFTTGC
jgi:hypothetical protein